MMKPGDFKLMEEIDEFYADHGVEIDALVLESS